VNVKLHKLVGEERTIVHEETMDNQIIVQVEDPVLQADDVLTFEAQIRQGFR